MNDGQTLPSWARRGVKVMCIDADMASYNTPYIIANSSPGDFAIVEKEIYTIREVHYNELHKKYLLCVAEHKRFITTTGQEAGYDIRRFAPLISNKSEKEDVAKFKDLLNVSDHDMTKIFLEDLYKWLKEEENEEV